MSVYPRANEVGNLSYHLSETVVYEGIIPVTPHNLDIPPLWAWRLAGVRVRETCNWWWVEDLEEDGDAVDNLARYYQDQFGIRVTSGHEISLFKKV
jgi:hypothetical protein